MSAKREARNRRILKARSDGVKLQVIADRFGVTRQRVHTILKELSHASTSSPAPPSEMAPAPAAGICGHLPTPRRSLMAKQRMSYQKDAFYVSVGGRLRELREQAGMSMAQLAKLCGVSASTIENAEGGQCFPFILAALAAHHLDVTMDDMTPLEAIEAPKEIAC